MKEEVLEVIAEVTEISQESSSRSIEISQEDSPR